MKHTLAQVALALSLVLPATMLQAQTRELGGSGALLDGVAAIVDNGVVLKSELQERRFTEVALRESEERSRQVIDTAYDVPTSDSLNGVVGRKLDEF